MNEFDEPSSPPAQPTPSRETIDRHRRQLQEAIAADRAARAHLKDRAGRSVGFRPRAKLASERSRLRRPAFTVIGVVVTCLAVAGTIALGTSGESPRGRSPSIGVAATSAPQVTPSCGVDPPAPLAVPAGYAGSPAAGSQLALTWTSSSGAIELRWPSDPTHPWPKQPSANNSSDGAFDALVDEDTTRTKTGVTERVLLFHFAGQPASCSTVQVTVYDSGPARVSAAVDALTAHPFELGVPRVTFSVAVSNAPEVSKCQAPPTVSVPPTRGSTSVASGSFADPESALAAFVDTVRTLPRYGYTEDQLPDGSIVYAWERPGLVVTTIHVAKVSDGWTVTEWHTSGC